MVSALVWVDFATAGIGYWAGETAYVILFQKLYEFGEYCLFIFVLLRLFTVILGI